MIKHIEKAMAELIQKKHGLVYVRSNSIDSIVEQIKNTYSGVFLVEGLPGIGKSAGLGPISDAVGAHNPERVISYYFSSTDSVLSNADNFYEYACKRVEGIIHNDSDTQGADSLRSARKDYIDFQQALAEFGEYVGNDVERRVYLFIDGIEELRDNKEFLGRLPYVEGVVYVLFAQPGVCDGALSDRFHERGKIKNHAEIKYLDKTHAEVFFWEAYGKRSDEEPDDFKSGIAQQLVKFLRTEENRYPLLLKVLAEDAREDGFNSQRAWANDLTKYFSLRVAAFSENVRRMLVLFSLALGPVERDDVCDLLGFSVADVDSAIMDAKRFLNISGKGIQISHNAWKEILARDYTRKEDLGLFLNWCAGWKSGKMRKSAEKYIATYYIFHILAAHDSKLFVNLMSDLFRDEAYADFTLKHIDEEDVQIMNCMIDVSLKQFKERKLP